jgi:flagellar biosynthetic protein FliR
MITAHTGYVWLMVFGRAGGLFALMPVFSGQTVPVQIRVAIAALIACVMTGLVHSTGGLPPDLTSFIFATARELLIGLIMGAVVRIVFYAIEFGGQIMSTEMGLMMSSQIDPISRSNSSPVGSALFYLGCILFLSSGSHHLVFAAFLRSFDIAPIGQLAFTRNVAEGFVQSSGKIFLLGVQMAAPLIAINFVVTFAFSVLGKAATSIHVFAEALGVRIMAGFAIFFLALALTARLVLSCMSQSPELMLQMVP